MNFRELQDRLDQWCVERNVYEGSTEKDQVMGGLVEIAEAADASVEMMSAALEGQAENIKSLVTDIMVELADVIVFAINAAKIAGYHLEPPAMSKHDFNQGLFARMAKCLKKGQYQVVINTAYSAYCDMCVDPEEAYDLVWDKIKDRRGKMQNGIFVKL